MTVSRYPDKVYFRDAPLDIPRGEGERDKKGGGLQQANPEESTGPLLPYDFPEGKLIDSF